MFVQHCPRCESDRVRRGYRHTPWYSVIIGRYQLLCDNCNWEFVGYAVPGMVSHRPRGRRRQNSSEAELPNAPAAPQFADSNVLSENVSLTTDAEPTPFNNKYGIIPSSEELQAAASLGETDTDAPGGGKQRKRVRVKLKR